METELSAPSAPTFQFVQRTSVIESATNPRRRFEAKPLEELAESIRRQGIISPLLVRPIGQDRYEVVYGARRYRAATMAELDWIPVIIREMTDEAVLEAQIVENLQREDIHPLDEGLSYRSLMQQLRYDVPAVAAKVGKSTSYIYQRLKLSDLIPEVQDTFLADPDLTVGHALAIARLQPRDQQRVLHEELYDREWDQPTGEMRPVVCKVKDLSDWIEQEILLDLEAAPFSKASTILVPEAGPCITCLKRTGFVPELFPDIKDRDTCTDPQCFATKMQAHIDLLREELEAEGTQFVELSGNYQWGKDEKIEGVLTRNLWTELRDGESCDYEIRGLIVAGRGRGSTVRCCTEATCRRHNQFRSDVTSEKQKKDRLRNEEKRRAEEQSRTKVFEAIRDVVDGPLPRAVLDLVVKNWLGRIWSENLKNLARLYGFQKGQKGEVLDFMREKISGFEDKDLAWLMIAMTVIGDLRVIDYQQGPAWTLNAIAQLYGVDPEGYRKEVVKEVKKKPTPKEKPRKAA